MSKVDKKELLAACDLLGIDSSAFVREETELEKGIVEVDYKALYEEQKSINIQLIQGLAKIPELVEKGVQEKLSEKIDSTFSQSNEGAVNILQEIQKSLTDVKEVKEQLSQLSELKEVLKGVQNISQEIENFKRSPIHQGKAFRSVQAVEKAVVQQNGGANEVYSLSNPANVKQLKSILGQKMVEQLEKGVNNSVYERAAMQLDSSKTIAKQLRDSIFATDKILIED